MSSTDVMPSPPARAADGEEAIDDDHKQQPARRDGAHTRRPQPQSGGPVSAGHRARTISLIVRFIAGVLILAMAIAIAGALVANRRQAIQAPIGEAARRVRTVEVVPRPAESALRLWEGFGTARARDQADVAAEVTARVVLRPSNIDPGVAVRAGEVLLRLEESDFRERMQAAQSAADSLRAQIEGLEVEESRLTEQVAQVQEQLRLTRMEQERLEQARLGAAATEIEMIRIQSTLARLDGERIRVQQMLDAIPTRRSALQADLAARRNEAAVAERQLSRTTILSPIDGILQSIDANVGEMVQSGQRIARVVDLRRIEIPLRVPASAQGEIRLGDQATVHARSAGVGNGFGQSWRATVARIAPEADPQTRTITVFLEVEQTPPGMNSGSSNSTHDESWSNLLIPGRFVSAELRARAGNSEMLIVIPRRAVLDDRVWVAVPDESGRTKAQPRQVRVLYHVDARYPDLDAAETQWAVIGAGIRAGDQIIVTNLDELSPGIKVEVVADAAEDETAQR